MADDIRLDGKKIWIPGSNGMVAAALIRRLQQENVDIITSTKQECDLTNHAAVDSFYARYKPEIVFVAAAKVGGIHANSTAPADFIQQNLAIQTNIISLAADHGVAKLVFLGSSCIYPRDCPQPIQETYLMTGPLESTNEWYAIAKIAGIKLCQAYRRQYGHNFITVMPTNLYGPNDNFHPTDSHVPAALLMRFYEARLNGKEIVTVWGSGKPKREFMHVDDLADACVFLAATYSGEEPINVGTGGDISIADFANMIADIVAYTGNIEYDNTLPDGTPRKLLDVTQLHSLGWRHTITLQDGLQQYYQWYLDNVAT